MSVTVSHPDDQPLTRQQAAAIDRSRPNKVTGRLKQALDLMVWECKTDNEAAVTAKLNVLSIRNALRRPHVRAYYLGQLDVLRTRERPGNIHALIAVRDQTGNAMARVNAAKALEQLEDQPQSRGGQQQAPGLVVQIINQATPLPPHQREINANPLIEHTSVSHHDETPSDDGS